MDSFEGVYYGIDIGSESAIISYYGSEMEEPKTVSTVLGSEIYTIPLFLAKKTGIGQWFYGTEAKKQAENNNAFGVGNLYEKALSGESIEIDGEVFTGQELLFMYLRKLLVLAEQTYMRSPIQKVVIAVDDVTTETIKIFEEFQKISGLSKDQILIIDKRETFYYYTLCQDERIYSRDVILFDFDNKNIKSVLLNRNKNTRPQVITLEQKIYPFSGDKDTFFSGLVDECTEGREISSAYLMGDGFDGTWMKESLTKICHGRRVFLGKNLYSKGACYAGMVKDGYREWPYAYIGDNELKLNLSLKVNDGRNMAFYPLINAGENWYVSRGECEVILDGTPEFECWIQRPESRKAKVEMLKLNDFPERPNRMTRLRIVAEPVSDREIRMQILDLGFGEMARSTGRSWQHMIKVENGEEEDGIWAS